MTGVGIVATIRTLMTLLVALKGQDGLVLAADSRGTFGDPRGVTAQNDAQQKAHVLSRHVAVLTAGSGAVGAMVIDLVRPQVTAQNLDGATPVMAVLRDTVRAQYQNWFPSVPAIQPLASIQGGQVAVRPLRVDRPSLPLMVIPDLFGCPIDEALFTLWYLRGKKFIEMTDDGMAITVAGVDYVESHEFGPPTGTPPDPALGPGSFMLGTGD